MNVYISEKRANDSHVTTMFCYHTMDEKMKPFIILPHMSYLPFAFGSDFNPYFASQQNGWMTRTLFVAWFIHFVSELNHIIMLLPIEIRNQEAIFIIK